MRARTNQPDATGNGRGSVSDLEAYPLRELQRRLGIGNRLCCDLQRQGLRTFVVGRTKFILGSDVLEFFRKIAEQQAQQAGQQQGGSQ